MAVAEQHPQRIVVSNLGDMAYEGAYSDFSVHGFIEWWRDEDELGNTAPARHAYRGVGEDEESKTNPSRTVPSASASLESLSANKIFRVVFGIATVWLPPAYKILSESNKAEESSPGFPLRASVHGVGELAPGLW